MSLKVVAVSAGEAHTLALTADGSVFSWGRGTFGRLGSGKNDEELAPVPIASGDALSTGDHNVPRPSFVGIATGAYHSLALQDDGSVWSWGYNVYGQLGHDNDNCSIPCLVEHFKELGTPESLADTSSTDSLETPLKISSVEAGGMMSLAIDNHGSLWIWGNCPQTTENGEFHLSSITVPLPVWDFHGHTVVKVACGNEHVVAVVSAGEAYTGDDDLVCYAWGNNKHGQLGLGDNQSRSRPEVISMFSEESPWVVYEVACGAFHTALLANKKSYNQEIESKCWTFGLGENGQLGHGTTKTACFPEPVDALPQDSFLISLACGLFHTSVVSSAGDVWSWGMEKGLGLCPDASFTGTDAGDAHFPLRIRAPETNGIRFTGPVQVACGAAHTILVSENGYKLWAWGRGRSGVLGTGQTVDSYLPTAVIWPPKNMSFKHEKQKTDDVISNINDAHDGKLLEMNHKLSAAEEELNLLKTKLALMERYARLLHISIFRKPIEERRLQHLLQDSGVFDIRKEMENVLEKSDDEELTRMEMFYRGMLSTVKDKLMKRRVQELVKESLLSLSTGRQHHSSH